MQRPGVFAGIVALAGLLAATSVRSQEMAQTRPAAAEATVTVEGRLLDEPVRLNPLGQEWYARLETAEGVVVLNFGALQGADGPRLEQGARVIARGQMREGERAVIYVTEVAPLYNLRAGVGEAAASAVRLRAVSGEARTAGERETLQPPSTQPSDSQTAEGGAEQAGGEAADAHANKLTVDAGRPRSIAGEKQGEVGQVVGGHVAEMTRSPAKDELLVLLRDAAGGRHIVNLGPAEEWKGKLELRDGAVMAARGVLREGVLVADQVALQVGEAGARRVVVVTRTLETEPTLAGDPDAAP